MADRSLYQVIGLVRKYGLATHLTNTGHRDWQRGFLVDQEGISRGRMVIYQGEFQHVHWYVCSPYVKCAIGWELQFDRETTPEDWDNIFKRAQREQAQDLFKRQQKRKLLEKRDMEKHGYVKKRKSIKGRDISYFFRPIWEETIRANV